MSYTTLEFYTNEYFGEHLEQEEFSSLLKHAERKIDSLTFYRIRKNGIETFSEFIQHQIQLATCSQIEYFKEAGGTSELAVSKPDNVSIGRTSISDSNFASTATSLNSGLIGSDVRSYLAPTGLLYNGVGVR
ncbi:hypothetical protein ORY89_06490 [Listeria monocytogenes]|uniref:hypothetical protein n=1 Tax=Listeria TaxID=1637 RepID=UPI001908825B|nr:MULTISPECIES: hypothetical protein [Listeria]MBK1965101.1 hypothetical protein [Listeria ivanovii subsp. londoniensis]WDE53485.1 hypothetical protein ORY89_06490 [Listeria monocytogenes]HEM1440037.1 hypothetical protein [Listeria monocytogenes]